MVSSLLYLLVFSGEIFWTKQGCFCFQTGDKIVIYFLPIGIEIVPPFSTIVTVTSVIDAIQHFHISKSLTKLVHCLNLSSFSVPRVLL